MVENSQPDELGSELAIRGNCRETKRCYFIGVVRDVDHDVRFVSSF